MTDVERLKALLPCLPGAYLVRKPSSGTANGKVETDYTCLRGELTDAHYEAHLDGRQALAVSPFLTDGKSCQWLVIDIDRYGIELKALQAHIKATLPVDLPLVPVPTKSGGWHLFLFLTAPAESHGIYTLANKIRFWLNDGPLKLNAHPKPKTEIETRPAQAMIKPQEGDTGNFITLPLFNSTPEQREEFFQLAEASRIDPEALAALVDEDEFADGPCCLWPLKMLAERDGWSSRNMFIYQMTVFFQKKYPTDWKERVHNFNREFLKPALSKEEVEKTLDSIERTGPHYRCNSAPFDGVCNEGLCRRRRFGVNAKGVLQFIDPDGLVIINSDPPVWWLTVFLGGQTARMKLTTAELQNPRSFKKRCMEVLHQMPDLPSPKDWEIFVNDLMKRASIVPQPDTMTDEAKMWALIWRFYTSHPTSTRAEDLLDGKIYVESTPNDGSYAHFRHIDLEMYLERSRAKLSGSLFASLKQIEMTGQLGLSIVKLQDVAVGECWRVKIPDNYAMDKIESNMT